ncbi:hypothetical protein [Nonomuraea turcica]|uniref:hypothetical protein n=1 Tax=Nonomuraea sp. G32 TaxID=3067274 RepID=UPI00273BD0C1|nr:hypothetical protein [Nonomuraea sp. G32]MDP4501012.1 hypothetical protein [Nonomuraea sp. G32]
MNARMEPEFMDPPPVRPSQGDEWKPTAEALIKNSGKWARVFIGDYKTANRLTRRIRQSRDAWAGHTWEYTTRNTASSSEVHVYARHVALLNHCRGGGQ